MRYDVETYLHKHYDQWLFSCAEEYYYGTEQEQRDLEYTLEHSTCGECTHYAVDEYTDRPYCDLTEEPVQADDAPMDHECEDYAGPILEPDE